MAFENNTNLGRVDKMIETPHLIEKSTTANRATNAQIKAVLTPLMEALGSCSQDDDALDTASVPPMPVTSLTAGERAALHLADKASIRGLTSALLGRLEAQQLRIDAAGIEDVEQ
ncbi:hypothetical protein ROLI_048080 (plasmid) [Roseobacter fucihabitans]|uniref:Uncharacterized protein n=1 Tax=Roseobacter fucihabitans TaxID=1537242 RepID=A0ABZ2BZS9_9RHOB|nr:hypothetical protein [Roseobacter litoralis]MBC6967299.1 hypothetical protein [Roseobacter litoralis]